MNKNLNAIATIAYRDVVKLARDRMRIVATFIFPLVFIGFLGTSLDRGLSGNVGFNFLDFVFVGVLAQTLFQSTAAGIISLIEDRQNDFSQEIFVSPISRLSIVVGKIIGEGVVSLILAVGILIIGPLLGANIGFVQLLRMIPGAIATVLFGGAFGIIVMANINTQRSANQIFPFLLFPQFFLAGVFTPIRELPLPIFILSRIAPLTYPVDLMRNLYYGTQNAATLYNPLIDLGVMIILGSVFLLLGTYIFIKGETNR